MKKIFCLLIIGFFLMPANGTHLAGGNIEVVCVGGNQFRIGLVKYKDPLGAPMAPPFTVTVDPMGSGSNQTLTLTQVSFNPSLPQPNTNPCLVPPPNSSLQEYVYQSGVVTLASGSGYYLYHGDNARNSTNTLTGQSSMLLYAEFPDPGVYGCNNSPRFNENPPMAVCLNEPLNYDGSATDPDGDVLEYRFCAALTYPPNSPPFNSALYAGGFSPTYPVSSNPSLAINQNTGLITGTPNLIGWANGRWTLSYCVDEYRNGVKIGQYNREVQMAVTNCTPISATIGGGYTSIALGMDVIGSCDDYTVKFKNSSLGGSSFFWDFGVSGIDTDTSSQFEPTFTYPDTGKYQVKLVVSPGDSCADSVVKTVVVYPNTNPDFSYASPACQGQPVLFSDQSTMTYGSAIYWSWQFGDGGSSNQQHPIHTFDSFGIFEVQMLLESSTGCRQPYSKPVEINPKPQSNLQGVAMVCPGDTVFPVVSANGVKFEWTPSSAITCDSCLHAGFFPTQNTTYTLTTSDSMGCQVEDTIRMIAGSTSYIQGTAFDSDGLLLKSAKVYLIDFNLVDSSLTRVDSTTTDSSGSFSFYTDRFDVYIQTALRDSNNKQDVPTYFGDAFLWDTAQGVMNLLECDTVQISIHNVKNHNPGLGGLIAGNVYAGPKHLFDTTNPIAGLPLILLNPSGQPVGYSLTDAKGYFRFDSIITQRHTIWVDLPYGRNDEAPSVFLHTGNTKEEDLVVKLDDRQLFIYDSLIGIWKPPFVGFEIYPNPASTFLYLQADAAVLHGVEISIVNAIGIQVLYKSFAQGLSPLDIRKLPSGMYFLELLHNGERQVLPVSIMR